MVWLSMVTRHKSMCSFQPKGKAIDKSPASFQRWLKIVQTDGIGRAHPQQPREQVRQRCQAANCPLRPSEVVNKPK